MALQVNPYVKAIGKRIRNWQQHLLLFPLDQEAIIILAGLWLPFLFLGASFQGLTIKSR